MIRLLRNALYWTYDRGSWQWDVSCLIFIVIIFATPANFLESYTRNPLDPDQLWTLMWTALRRLFS
jgi:hypothetical protein